MKIKLIIIVTGMLILSAPIAKSQATLPKVKNYTRGKLDLKIAPFGLNGNEIKIGQILADGSIELEWPDIELAAIESSDLFMTPINQFAGFPLCTENKAEFSKTVKIVDTNVIFLYKKKKQVGSLFIATQKEMEDNNGLNRHTQLVLGSHISWFYSDGETAIETKCTNHLEWKTSYSFEEVTSLDIHFKKGWNMVQHTLLEREDWKEGDKAGSLPKKMSKSSISNLPENITVYVNYWGK